MNNDSAGSSSESLGDDSDPLSYRYYDTLASLLAEKLNLTYDELTTYLVEGNDWADIAYDQGLTMDDIQGLINEIYTDCIISLSKQNGLSIPERKNMNKQVRNLLMRNMDLEM